MVEPLGNEQIVHLVTEAGTPLLAVTDADLPVRPEAQLWVRIAPAAVHLFRAADGRRIGGGSG